MLTHISQDTTAKSSTVEAPRHCSISIPKKYHTTKTADEAGSSHTITWLASLPLKQFKQEKQLHAPQIPSNARHRVTMSGQRIHQALSDPVCLGCKNPRETNRSGTSTTPSAM